MCISVHICMLHCGLGGNHSCKKWVTTACINGGIYPMLIKCGQNTLKVKLKRVLD